jgi:structural maintenance of chromosome 1
MHILQENLKEQSNLNQKIDHASKAKATLERDLGAVQHQLNISKARKTETDRSLGTCKRETEIIQAQITEKEKSLGEVQVKIDERAEKLRKERAELQRINEDVYRDFCAELKISNISEFEGGTHKDHKERTEKLYDLTSQLQRQKAAVAKLKEQQKQAEDQEKMKSDEIKKINKEIEGHKAEKQSKEKEIRFGSIHDMYHMLLFNL